MKKMKVVWTSSLACKDVRVGDILDVFNEDEKGYVMDGCLSVYLKTHFKMEPVFTKSDLKDWMVVELRDGTEAVVNRTTDTLINIGSNNGLIHYNDALINTYASKWDIMKVFSPAASGSVDNIIQTYPDNLLWERKEKSDAELEIESIQAEMDKLNNRMEELKKNI